MTKRLLTAATSIALALIATSADAKSYYERGERGYSGHHHRHAVNGHPKRYAGSRSHRHAGSGTSRGCLTSAARALLGRIEAQFGTVQIVSTCRPGARIAGSGRPSRHASGNAIDFSVSGGRKAQVVRWLIANHRSGGTMTYANMSHIHVDVGPRFVSLGARGRG